MAGLLYVRTGNGGANIDVLVPDLGITIATDASWTLLSESSPGGNSNFGQFTARDLRDSIDLLTLIRNAVLEWSKDGVGVAAPTDYAADYQLEQDLTDDIVDLNQLVLDTEGRIYTSCSGSVHLFMTPLPKSVKEDF